MDQRASGHPVQLCLCLALALALVACQPEDSPRVPKPPSENPIKRLVMHSPFTASSDLALLSAPGVLPRNIPLKTFDPHRDAAQFVCRHQAERMAAPTPAAQALHEEAMRLTSPALWPNERNWPRAMQLWQQAADQGHWKAALMWLHTARSGAGENSEKGRFRVEPQRPEVIVSGLERLMRLGLADAFYWMGELHTIGDGVNPSVDRAWAFWELAADLGSPLAQTRIAKALMIDYQADERPNEAAWANRPLKFKLFECAHAQGHGEASMELGRWLNMDAEHDTLRLARFKTSADQYAYALQVLHDGVKYGSELAAKYLSIAFDEGRPLGGSAFIDKDRSERYFELGNALYDNPDLRFPNLDRVLPLPPAKLPPWDMNDVDGLIRAAQGVRVTPSLPKASAELQRTRAHVPEGYAIAPYEGPTLPFAAVDHRYGQSFLVRAPQDGYYQVLHASAVLPAQELFRLPERLRHLRDDTYERRDRDLLAQTPPLFYREGETLSLASSGLLPQAFGFPEDARGHSSLYWRFVGTARPVRPLTDHLARAGLVQAIAQATDQCCVDGQICPTSGIWQPEVTNAEHPLAKVFNGTLAGESWRRQAFVLAGESMPSLGEQLAPVLAEAERAQLQVQWRLMVACERACGAGFAPESVGRAVT